MTVNYEYDVCVSICEWVEHEEKGQRALGDESNR